MRAYSIVMVAIAFMFASHDAFAVPLAPNGTDSFSAPVVTSSPSNDTSLFPISGIVSLDFPDGVDLGMGTGNLSGLPSNANLSNFFPSSSLGGGGGSAFTITFAGGDGTFTETAAPDLLSNTGPGPSSSAEFYLLGTLTPAGELANSLSSGTAFVDVTFSSNSTDISASGTLTAPAPPPTSVPEPASMAMLGTGVLGLLAARRRRTA